MIKYIPKDFQFLYIDIKNLALRKDDSAFFNKLEIYDKNNKSKNIRNIWSSKNQISWDKKEESTKDKEILIILS